MLNKLFLEIESGEIFKLVDMVHHVKFSNMVCEFENEDGDGFTVNYNTHCNSFEDMMDNEGLSYYSI